MFLCCPCNVSPLKESDYDYEYERREGGVLLMKRKILQITFYLQAVF